MTACGSHHSLFLSREGRIFACGFNEYGELGVEMGDQKNLQGEAQVILKCKPLPVQIQMEDRIRFIEAGLNHSLAISSSSEGSSTDSKLYSWGLSNSGQLGHHDVKNAYNLSKPKVVEFLGSESTKIVYVSASAKHTLCVDTDGLIWYFGEKLSVGIKDRKDKYQFFPQLLRASNTIEMRYLDWNYKFVSAGLNNNMVLT